MIVKLIIFFQVKETFENHQTEFIKINEQETIELKCGNHSLLQENIWTFSEHVNIEFKQNNALLKIRNIYPSQSGLYECLSITNEGNFLLIYNLSVNSNHVVKSLQGTSAILDCSRWLLEYDGLKNKQTKNPLQWKLNGKELLIEDSKYEFLNKFNTILKINNLSESNNDQEYSCLCDTNVLFTFKLAVGGKL